MSLNSFRHGMGNLTNNPVGKWSLFAVGGVLVASLVYSGLGNNLGNFGGGGGGAAAPAGADVVATVNGQPISRAQFDQTADNLRQQAQMQSQMQGGSPFGASQMAALNAQALSQATTGELALQRAEKMGLTASPDEIAKAREQLVTQDNVRQQLNLPATASLADINDALAKNNLTPLEQQDHYSDEALRRQVILQKLQATFAQPVTEQDARDSFRQWHTRHILIDNHKVSDVQAQSKAQQILAKALAPGADFAALANQYTDDPGNKDRTGKLHGGDDGWIDQNTGYVPEFKNAAFALKKGQITPQPVKSPQYGYFIIQAVDIRDNLPKDFDKNKAQYIDQVKQQREQAAQQAFLTQIDSDPANTVVVKDPALRGDQELAQAQQAADPTQRAAKLNAAIADLSGAVKGASFAQTGEINAALAQAYLGLNQPLKAIPALKAAVAAAPDQTLQLTLGNLYAQNKDPQDAIAQFQAVSTQAWNDPQIHTTLANLYKNMKRPDLAAKETVLAQQIQKRQPPPGASPLGNLSLSPPAGAGAPPAAQPAAQTQAVTVRPAAGQPAPPAPKPGQ